jgi:hypothetical protein
MVEVSLPMDMKNGVTLTYLNLSIVEISFPNR